MFNVRFWGVRGSIACPGAQYQRYGGNTSCVELEFDGQTIILDGGTGIRELGQALAARNAPKSTDVLLTHTHMDHIAGLPFFGPLFQPQWTVRIWAGHLAPTRKLCSVIEDFMSDPVFPVPPSIFGAKVSYNDFRAGASLKLDEIQVRTTLLNHPNQATGYRVEHQGKSVCYITDTEHKAGVLDQGIVDLVKGTDLLIYDCTYSDENYPAHVGWGHSTWQEGVRIADAAGAATLVVFHHDPANHDDRMDEIAAQAEAKRPGGVVVAKEGMVISLVE